MNDSQNMAPSERLAIAADLKRFMKVLDRGTLFDMSREAPVKLGKRTARFLEVVIDELLEV